MPDLMDRPPFSAVEPVVDVLHGVAISDPYRWLEDQNSSRTRAWIDAQTHYARAYLDHIPGRERIRERVRGLLDVDTYDSFLKCGDRYFFRKRLPGNEQPGIYMRQGFAGKDRLLIDPAARGTSRYTAVLPTSVSSDGKLLLYEIKYGGERTGAFELFDVEARTKLPDNLPRGHLRGFLFASDNKSFYYVHEQLDDARPSYRAVYHHRLGESLSDDTEIFVAGVDQPVRIALVHDANLLGILEYKFLEKTLTSLYVQPFADRTALEPVFIETDDVVSPKIVSGKVLALTNRQAPNFRIVTLPARGDQKSVWATLIPETGDLIEQWFVTREHIFLSYSGHPSQRIAMFDFSGKHLGDIPSREQETLRVVASSRLDDELILESESSAAPPVFLRYRPPSNGVSVWARRTAPRSSGHYVHSVTSYLSKDGTEIPIFLFGKKEVFKPGPHPAVMTSYGGFGMASRPRFSVLVSLLVECGCLFALPSIRGGSEFGAAWHHAARRHKRQNACDDFLAAAEWLVATGKTVSDRLAIFGGSNSGLLTAAALAQRPDLFKAVVCLVPLVDMLRYHLFDHARIWQQEFGTADNREDFEALARYSPYHRILNGASYPATLIVSGDADGNCNAFHARKLAARLQSANSSPHPILLDYSEFRGHAPVLPLGTRVEALTDRVAFLCDRLQLTL